MAKTEADEAVVLSGPVVPPIAPMLAKLSRELPIAPGMIYEPKWDGFRCIVFKEGDTIELASRNERPLTRYFPEVVAALRRELPPNCVLDGEIVIMGTQSLDFELLLQRIHPAASRIKLLSETTPASFVAFDLLSLAKKDLCGQPFAERRRRLETSLAKVKAPVYLTPATTDPELARIWFDQFEGAGLDGVVAKDPDCTYRPGERVMLKVKHERTADCVVAGYREHKDGGVGSLLLGLYDNEGVLHHLGVASGFAVARRREFAELLEPERLDDEAQHPWDQVGISSDGGRSPGAQSRWNAGRDLSFVRLAPVRVCEVAYDHLQGTRFRHATTFKAWRPDRDASSCTYDQLDAALPEVLANVLGA